MYMDQIKQSKEKIHVPTCPIKCKNQRCSHIMEQKDAKLERNQVDNLLITTLTYRSNRKDEK